MQPPQAQKNVVAIIALVAILSLSGCQFLNKGIAGTPDFSSLIYTGTEGIALRFGQNAPPDSMVAVSGTKVPVHLILENRGAVGVSRDAIFVSIAVDNPTLELQKGSSLNAPFFNADGKPQAASLSAITGAGSLEGKETYITGDDALVDLDVVLSDTSELLKVPTTSKSVVASVCYTYLTKASAGICIDTSPFSGEKAQRCPSTVTLKDQGAPVAITRVEIIPALTADDKIKPRFRIFVANIGRGSVVKTSLDAAALADAKAAIIGSVKNACGEAVPAPAQPLNFDVLLSKATFGSQELDCSKGWLSLSKSDKDFFVCDVKDANALNQGPGIITTDITVELSYGYRSVVSKIMTLEQLVD